MSDSIQPIPTEITAFLYWLKQHTETFWSKDRNVSPEENICPEWMQGARWIGMTDEQIDEVQEKYAVIFTPEHRAFLRILHTIDRKERVYKEYDSTEGDYYERPFFFNWLQDDEAIRARLNFPYDTILEDIESRAFWVRKSWGEKPVTAAERVRVFTDLFNKAPKLVPIKGHRFQVADMSLEKRPVLSVLGTDIVYYGSDIRNYLLSELREQLDIYHREYDKEEEVWGWAIKEVYKDSFVSYDKSMDAGIPFWSDFLLYD